MMSLSVLVTVLTLLPFVCLSFSPESLTHRRLLVLLDYHSLQSSHSSFFHSMISRGFDLDFKLAEDPNLSLQRYGQYLYDSLILFSPSAHSFGGALDVQFVLDFVDVGHDLILAADASASNLIRSIAKQCEANFDEGQVEKHSEVEERGDNGSHSLTPH